MSKNTKVSIVGCGHWGKNLVRNYHVLNCLDSIFDESNDTARFFSEKYNVPIKSLEEIAESKVSGVILATPATTHYRLTKYFLEKGKNVFVEKPLSLDVFEAQELGEIAKREGLVLMVGHLLQYHPCFLKLKEIVQEGDLGRIQYIYSNRLNLGKFRNEENILWSFAPHDISMILSLVNETPYEVNAIGHAYLNPTINDITTTHLKFKNGANAHIFVSWLHPYKEQKLVVVGEKGMCVFDDSRVWNEKLTHYPHKVNWVNGIPSPQKEDFINIKIKEEEPLKNECLHFLSCIQSGETPRTDAKEGLNVLKVLSAAQKSLKNQSSVKINHDQKDFFIHESSYVDKNCTVQAKTKIWHFSHILENSHIGEGCNIGQNVMIGPNVTVGNQCKIQNNVSLYDGVILQDNVFCGPSCVFTNVINPRAGVERKDEFKKTIVEKGCSIGANATILCGVKLGAYSLIGAGSVITKDVPPHAVMAGNPARQIGWVSHSGEILREDFVCKREGRKYFVNSKNQLIEMNKSFLNTEVELERNPPI